MPKRPRPHILEEESRNFFRDIIPQEWLFRDEAPDYGIDGSVEIFGDNNESIALRFFVQLKATDSTNIKTQKTVRFRSSTCAYWHKQNQPTLLVQYCSVARKAYWGWHFDRRISAKGETASLKFEESDQWSLDSPEKIQSQLVAITTFKDQPTNFPIPVCFLPTKHEDEIQIDEILRDEFANLTGLVAYGDLRPTASPIILSCRDDVLCIDFAGITSFTIPAKDIPPQQLAADVLVAIALGFSNLRKCHLVGRILKHAYSQSTLVANPFFSVWIAQDLAHEKDFPLLRTIASHLTFKSASYSGVSSYAFMPTMYPNLIPDDEKIKQMDFLIDHVEKVKNKFPKSHGLAAYNTAEFLLVNQKLRLAFNYFRIAIKSDIYYAKSDYVRSQASGILFRLKHYDAAAVGYLRTLRFKPKNKAEIMALFADAQLHRGKIGSAVFWLKKAIDKEELQRDPRINLFTIQLIAAEKIIKIIGTSCTNINTIEGARYFKLAQQGPNEDAIHLAMKSAILNPTSSHAWSLLRAMSLRNSENRLAQDYALIAASLSDGDPSYWMDLVVTCIFEPSAFSEQILISTFLCMPDHLAEEAYYRAKHADSQKQKEFYRDLGEHFSQLPRNTLPRVIRIRDMESNLLPEVLRLS